MTVLPHEAIVVATPVIVAIVQAELLPDVESALAATAQGIATARAAGATLVAFPETWIPGYPAWLDHCRDAALWDHPPVKRLFREMAEQSVTIPGPMADQLGAMARDAAVTLVVGVTERVAAGAGRGTLYNALLTFGPDGRLLNHHRKLVPTYTERMIWGPGDATGLRSVATPAGRVGGLVCWEHWMPLARQVLHEAGEDIHVAVWPWVHEMHQVACRQYAFEGRCFVLAAGGLLRRSALPSALTPRDDRTGEWVLRGGSAVIGPDGSYLTEPVLDRPAVIIATIDLGRCVEEHMTLDVGGHYHRPDVFLVSVHRARPGPSEAG